MKIMSNFTHAISTPHQHVGWPIWLCLHYKIQSWLQFQSFDHIRFFFILLVHSLNVGIKQKLRWSFHPYSDVYPSETDSLTSKNVGRTLRSYFD